MNKRIIIGLIAVGVLLAVACLVISIRNKAAYSISVIGGADGPTAIFVAGKLGGSENIDFEEVIDYMEISQTEAKALMDDKENGAIILDVRRPDEYAEGHIEGAINVPNESIIDKEPVELPDKHQLILVYCRSGRRSKEAAQKLVNMGYTDIKEFGGITTWPYGTVK